jgi:hypothetical protein
MPGHARDDTGKGNGGRHDGDGGGRRERLWRLRRARPSYKGSCVTPGPDVVETECSGLRKSCSLRVTSETCGRSRGDRDGQKSMRDKGESQDDKRVEGS